jgi:hypothetical protein
VVFLAWALHNVSTPYQLGPPSLILAYHQPSHPAFDKPPNHSSIPSPHSVVALHYSVDTSHSTPLSHITSYKPINHLISSMSHSSICSLANQCCLPGLLPVQITTYSITDTYMYLLTLFFHHSFIVHRSRCI